MQESKIECEVTDIGLATALAVKGYTLKLIRPVDHRRSVFVFESSSSGESPDKLEADYWANNLLVPAQQFHQQMKIIKSRLYGERGL